MRTVLIIAGVIGAALLLVASSDIGIKGTLFRQAIPAAYFEPYNDFPPTLEPVTANVYSFRVGFNRGLVVDSDAGIAVFDTFNPEFAAALKSVIAERFPGKHVQWVFYSHHHFDHIRGAQVLEPAHIVGHHEINATLDDWPHAADIARVTDPINGDTEMMLGSTRVQLLFMPRSHSLSLYGIYLPEHDVVFAPDMMFVRTMPPFGFPDWYYPGYIKALDRLIALDAAHYVPSHFDNGGHADLVDYRNMMVSFRDTIATGLSRYGYDAASGDTLRKVFDEAYPVLRERYGEWHGFDAMFVPHFGGQAGGTYLGF